MWPAKISKSLLGLAILVFLVNAMATGLAGKREPPDD